MARLDANGTKREFVEAILRRDHYRIAVEANQPDLPDDLNRQFADLGLLLPTSIVARIGDKGYGWPERRGPWASMVLPATPTGWCRSAVPSTRWSCCNGAAGIGRTRHPNSRYGMGTGLRDAPFGRTGRKCGLARLRGPNSGAERDARHTLPTVDLARGGSDGLGRFVARTNGPCCVGGREGLYGSEPC